MPGGHFSNEEKLDMLTCHILCYKNTKDTAETYLDKFSERRQPNGLGYNTPRRHQPPNPINAANV
ncbi:unnamed protein product [Acanthoscelides obtectus]|uniref:Uncharacterized protein n=1 Tax=Acanthoscelides obtectus TaxID=200917 RepID=A0A9P0K2V0_ACAOB|nr:unnamed protein product [Acanthoscelides obtectus]CAK1627541.1 hypothetical protein AOBTE_LOCUS4652 [Acanthoscelides obtectus]